MAVPWLVVGKLVLANLDTVIDVVKPVFTRKKVEAVANQTDLLNQQISELQAASSTNAEQITELAAQLKQVVTALDQAALNVAAERERTRTLCLVAITISVISIIAAIVSIVAG
jgi:hypothetical protein